MSNQIGNRSPLHQRRLRWLKRNRHIWHTYDSQLPGALATEKVLLDKMITARLYPKNATLLDTSIDKLINKIRVTGRPKKMLYKRTDD